MIQHITFLIFSLLVLVGLFSLRKRFKSSWIRAGFVGLQGLYVLFVVFLFEEPLQNVKYALNATLSSEYQKAVELVKPYFDEEFYLNSYGDQVKKSGLAPIDHFLQRGWHSSEWSKHTDPNSWFNTTLYKERLWPVRSSRFAIDEHPFVSFLKRPKLKAHSQSIDIYAQKGELERAFYAVEGLMHLDQYNVVLHIPKGLPKKDLIRFEPQVIRGLKLAEDNSVNKSFYQSEFLRHPDRYIGVTPEYSKEGKTGGYITYVRDDLPYTLHRLYHFKWWTQKGWLKKGYINPMLINVAHYCDEPLIFMGYSNLTSDIRKFIFNIFSGTFEYPKRSSPKDFTDYMVRIASGFDLCLFDIKLPIDNLKLIPGYMHSHVDESELNARKDFEVSFLLSLGRSLGKGSLKSYRDEEGFKYGDRLGVWNRQGELTTPTKFYLSSRDKDAFPEDMQARTLPTDSKKWLFNSQYHVAIENTQQVDYFTEKVLDCFVSRTIPIYLGCPNIGDYFDTRGMIIVESPNEIIEAVNKLTPETYQTMRPYIEENYKRAQKFLTLEKDAIRELGKRMGSQTS